MNHTIHIPLEGVAHDIHIGSSILQTLPDKIKYLFPKQKNIVIITDQTVSGLYLKKISDLLANHNYRIFPLVLQEGEKSKSFANLEKAVHFCLENHIERDHAIIALGGGVIGDLTGFVASMIRRGCYFIQIPTTLLAQVDSSVGGKTAINTIHGKNLVGAFYQPAMVMIDIDFLETLSVRHYYAGYAEILKYALLGDKEFFHYLQQNQDLCDQRDPKFLTKIICHCVQMKADIVLEDEKEKGKRALLNLGHSFGHAYEALTEYSDTLYHGEAVALGMCHAFSFSMRNGFCSQGDVTQVIDVIGKAHLPTDIRQIIPDVNAQEILAVMKQDKKVQNGQMTLILNKEIGQSFIENNVDLEELKSFLETL